MKSKEKKNEICYDLFCYSRLTIVKHQQLLAMLHKNSTN